MFRSFTPDPKSRRSPRIAPKTCIEEFNSRLPLNTLKGMKVLWRQSQMAQSIRGSNRDGQMPVEELSDTSDSSDTSSPNFLEVKHRVGRPKRRQKKDAGVTEIKKEVGQGMKASELSVTPQEVKVVDKKKEVTEVGVQAMRPASIDSLIEGRLNMLESRLRLEEMRSKAWCVRMTEAEDNVKQLHAQVKALSAGAIDAGTQNRSTPSPPRERGLWPTNSVEGRKTLKLGANTSQVFCKDFTSELNAILQQIRKDNESEEMVGDFCVDAKI